MAGKKGSPSKTRRGDKGVLFASNKTRGDKNRNVTSHKIKPYQVKGSAAAKKRMAQVRAAK